MVAARRRPRRWILLLVAIPLVVLFTAGGVANFYTDLLWAQEVEKTGVFWGLIGSRFSLGLIAGIGAALIVALNLFLAERLAPRYRLTAVPRGGTDQYRAMVSPYLRPLRIGVSLFLGLIIGLQSTSLWPTFLLWRNRVPFGETDPQFHRDIGFYVFELPMQRAAFGWLFSILILTTLMTAVAHYLLGGIRPQDEHHRIAAPVITHLSVLIGLIVLLKAWAYRLDQFELLYSSSGAAMGAFYTDVSARLPALQFLVGAAVLSAILFFYNARQRGYLLPLAGMLVLGMVSVLVGGAYPAFVQRFQVAPQELEQEATYIQRNIDATQRAFGLADVQPQTFEASTEPLSEGDLDANRQMIESIRLWEQDTLQTGVANLQAIGQYYSFNDMDVDRYEIDGEVRQVMIGAREANPSNLQASARTWQNMHLAYTHGFGVVAAQVADIEGEGRPVFLNQGFSQEDAPIPVEQPRIYFGEQSPGSPAYVVARSKQLEVGAPTESGSGAADFTYDGEGGIQLSNPLRRLAFALRFQDANLILSDNLTPDSRLMFDRDISTRIEKAAPFLEWDVDPYVAVIDGRIKFIRDGYTTTDMYPYSQRTQLEDAARVGGSGEGGVDGRANYIRNSVKAVVDAYEGTVEFYIWDEEDPLVKAWSKAFPDLFTPRSEISESLQAHFRYPQDLFAVQTSQFQSYHIDDAREFYSRQDYWDLPQDRSGEIQTQEDTPSLVGSNNGAQRALPYYLLTNLPGSDQAEFALVTPFTPNNRANMVSYMAARPTEEGTGQILLLNLPRSRQIGGPAQVNAQILADPAVARDVLAFNQQGSQITMGNLLTIPIEDSFMYVQPMFVQARGNAIPELKRVAAYFNGTLGYAATLPEALDAVLEGGGSVAPPADDEAAAPPADDEAAAPPADGEQPPAAAGVDQLLEDAGTAMDQAQQALSEGNLGQYQQSVDRARQLIEQARQESGAPAEPPAEGEPAEPPAEPPAEGEPGG